MSDSSPLLQTSSTSRQWSEDLIFDMLGNPVRRKILLHLARYGTKTAAELSSAAHTTLFVTLKQLVVLRRSGLVLKSQKKAKDGRCWLYTLVELPVQKSENGLVLDFPTARLEFR